MIKCEVKNYLQVAEPPDLLVFDEVKRVVSSGISLEDSNTVRQETGDKIIDVISLGIYRATDFLHVPMPEVGLIYPWNGGPGADFVNNEHVLASADISDENPDGIVLFSPLYLQSVADYMDGKNYGNAIRVGITPLESVSSHEVYHLWQLRHFPVTVSKDCHKLRTLGHDVWNKTRTEMAAGKFGIVFKAKDTQDDIVSISDLMPIEIDLIDRELRSVREQLRGEVEKIFVPPQF